MQPNQDITWNTVTLLPGIEAKAGQHYQTMMSACGRVLVSVGPDNAWVYRRNQDGDYELAETINLTQETGAQNDETAPACVGRSGAENIPAFRLYVFWPDFVGGGGGGPRNVG